MYSWIFAITGSMFRSFIFFLLIVFLLVKLGDGVNVSSALHLSHVRTRRALLPAHRFLENCFIGQNNLRGFKSEAVTERNHWVNLYNSLPSYIKKLKRKCRLVLQWNTSWVNVWPVPAFLQLFSLLGISGQALTLTWMWKQEEHLRERPSTYFSLSVLTLFLTLKTSLLSYMLH